MIAMLILNFWGGGAEAHPSSFLSLFHNYDSWKKSLEFKDHALADEWLAAWLS